MNKLRQYLIISSISLFIALGYGNIVHASYVFEEDITQMRNFYYHIAVTKESEVEDIAIGNLTQTLRSYGPKDSKYLTPERVHRMVFDQNATDLAVLLAEMRRKAEYEVTSKANEEAASLNVPDQGKVYQKLRELEVGLKQRATGDNASRLAPERTYTDNASQQSWHNLIESGNVLQLFTVTDIAGASALVQELYQLEQDLAALQVELTTDQNFGTMFENGSTEDSFYDLVDDINVLDTIWYGEGAEEFSASWFTPQTPPASLQDPRIIEGTNEDSSRILRLGQASGVFIPQTNQPLSALNETMQSRDQATEVSSLLDARAEDRSFMPLFTELNTNIEIPGNHEKFCTGQKHFCLKVDINILSYPLFGSSDFSLVQQLREWQSELSDMSQKNLTIKTVGKNIFEIGLTPGADLGELLSMNIITSTKPMNFPTEEKTVEERAIDVVENLKKDLQNCQNTAIAATNSISQGGSTILTPVRNIIETQLRADETCAAIIATQHTVQDQELRDELHTRTLTQFNVMTQIIKTILFEFEEIHNQTITIEGKPRK